MTVSVTHWVYGWRDKGETETKFRGNHSLRSKPSEFGPLYADTIERKKTKKNWNLLSKSSSISCALSSSLQTTPCFTLFILKSPPLAHNAFRFSIFRFQLTFLNANLFVRTTDFRLFEKWFTFSTKKDSWESSEHSYSLFDSSHI